MFSTAARRMTLAPHCVSRMFMRKKNCTMAWKTGWQIGAGPIAFGAAPPRQPARADHAIGLAGPAHQIQKGRRLRRAVGIDVSDQIGRRRQPESLDQRPAFADRIRVLFPADDRKFRRHGLDHAKVLSRQPLRSTTNETSLMLGKVFGVAAQNGANPALLVVGRNQQQKTGKTLVHAAYLPKLRVIVEQSRWHSQAASTILI